MRLAGYMSTLATTLMLYSGESRRYGTMYTSDDRNKGMNGTRLLTDFCEFIDVEDNDRGKVFCAEVEISDFSL